MRKSYRDPTADTAIANVDRELRRERKRREEAQRREEARRSAPGTVAGSREEGHCRERPEPGGNPR